MAHTYRAITVGNFPAAKLRKLAQTGDLNLSASEVAGSTHTLYLHPESYAKIQKAKKTGKGVRLKMTKAEIEHNIMHGGGFWDSIKKFFATNGTKILDSIAAVGKVVAPEFTPAINAGREIARKVTGAGVHEQRLANLAKARAAKQKKNAAKGGSFLRAGH